MKSLFLNLIVLLLVAVSCGEKKNTESKTEALRDKVMAIHDEVMPKLSDIMKLKKELNSKIDELVAAGEADNAARIDELEKAVEDLENSHDGMMNWMREYNPDFEGMVQEEVMDYLGDQKTKIENVSRATNSAINNAQELLSK